MTSWSTLDSTWASKRTGSAYGDGLLERDLEHNMKRGVIEEFLDCSGTSEQQAPTLIDIQQGVFDHNLGCPQTSEQLIPSTIDSDWRQHLSLALSRHALVFLERRQRERTQLTFIAHTLEEVREQLTELTKAPMLVPLSTLAPEPYILPQPLQIVIREVAPDDYVASLFDAGISSSGDTPEEAFANVREVIVFTLDLLAEYDEERLGAEMARKKRVLESLVQAAD